MLWSLRGEEPIPIESGFGRLRIDDGKAAAGKTISMIIDESFVFQAIYNFIRKKDEGFNKHIMDYSSKNLSSRSGPDIDFVLRIDDQLCPVFVHNKLLRDTFPGNVEKPRLTVYETRLKAYLPTLATYCPGGKYLSLIYDHPAIVKTLREGWNSGDVWGSESEIGTDHY
ncbi:hypothetical protein EC957_001414 [Mortierella hygrophila]|uniref:Uncharacterized protein n=1 Tax=Mortierella hygrophila TaxID=979708 RepID=A0A9P6F6A3_9FUNG|nr:hypothetical protein EC957_001414 [Mortierella hygrophila]